jgi:hypothetical protein
MGTEEEEPDYDALWERIETQSRRAGHQEARHFIQQIDLSEAINRDDIAGYVERWYPAPTPNGPSITFVVYDEYALWREDTVNPPAVRRKLALRRQRAQRKLEDGTADGYVVSAWQVGSRCVGYRSRLLKFARRLLRRC